MWKLNLKLPIFVPEGENRKDRWNSPVEDRKPKIFQKRREANVLPIV